MYASIMLLTFVLLHTALYSVTKIRFAALVQLPISECKQRFTIVTHCS